ncbi:MAG: B12-binding domain-containing radical SAM protein [Oligoflexia bacterium]|nr:B12-binding domain-containing radical SAM protein [Oligoflexia bacterium]
MNREYDIVFIQQHPIPYFGISSIASYLFNAGFKCCVLIDELEKNLIRSLRVIECNLIGISVISIETQWLQKITALIKSTFPEKYLIVGGLHAILRPQEILANTVADLVCNSEGESVVLNVIRELRKQKPEWHLVEGIGYREKTGKIVLNDRAALLVYSEAVIESRDIYYSRYPLLAKDATHTFMSSRGCPYRCSFCYNSSIHDIFKQKGNYVRQKSVANFIMELSVHCGKYKFHSIFFYDDLFIANRRWLKQFLPLYKKEVGLPFICTARADLLDEIIVALLAQAGCKTISFGIESGNYQLRRDILNKNINNQQIINAGRIVHSAGLNLQTTNMFCIPGEDVHKALETIELNILAKTKFAFSSFLTPFPETAIEKYLKQFSGGETEVSKLPSSFLKESVVHIEQKEIIKNIHYLAYFSVRYPCFYKYFTKNFYRYKILSPLFYLLFMIGALWRHKQERNISLFRTLLYVWRLKNAV